MNSGLYAACAALIARTQTLEVAANNLANVNTAGYKAQQVAFQSLLAKSGAANLSPINRAINDFAVLGGTVINRAAGNFESTGSEFDLAVEGAGCFAVQTKAGVRYTRDGRFQVSTQGALTTSSGDAVLGDQGPVRLPNGPLSVAPDGTISVNGAVTGKLKMVEFAPGAQLRSEGGSYYSAPAGTERTAVNSSVRQGVIESSNVNPMEAAVGLVALQRHFEMLQRALSIFHSDFNRIAVEDLPRV